MKTELDHSNRPTLVGRFFCAQLEAVIACGQVGQAGDLVTINGHAAPQVQNPFGPLR